MTTKTALFALLAAWGVGLGACPPALAETTASDDVAEDPADDGAVPQGLVNRVWTQTGSDLPGTMRIFLSDGTLVQDSCWETHRLSEWRMVSDDRLVWNEDGMDIFARIASVDAGDLVLVLEVGGSLTEEHYVSAGVPYVCPDIPKD